MTKPKLASDLIIILIISACVYGGYRHGLARCLLKFLTSILAIIIALFLYKPFVNFIINNTTIDDHIALSFEKVINNNSGNNDKIVSDDSGLPKPIENYMNKNIKETVDEKKEAAISEVSKNAAILIIDIAGVIVIYIIAKIIFTNAPAATIAILLGMLAFVNEPSFSDCSASPSMFTNPPSGINLSSYLVSFPCFFQITGPNPIANSFTLTLQSFAIRKWPVSWIAIRKPNKNIILIALIKKLIKFLSLKIYLGFCKVVPINQLKHQYK